MHPYDIDRLDAAMDALGKAFDFADKHLSGGMDEFYRLFADSPMALTFDGPDAHPAIESSGIELVLAVTGSSATGGLEALLLNERRLPRGERGRARWCGRALARHQWETGRSFHEIYLYLSPESLRELYGQHGTLPLDEVSNIIEQDFARSASPTRLRRRRDAAGLSQTELARASGVSLRAIQQYEQRKKDINHARAISVLHLARSLGCRIEDLLEL